MKRKVKIEKYQDLEREIGRLRGISHLEVVLVVVGALGVVSNKNLVLSNELIKVELPP